MLVNIIPSMNMGEYDSSYTLRCNGMQGPFNSTLYSFEWRNSNGVVTNDTRRSTRVIPSGLDGYYRQFFFNTSLDIQNLRVEDAGIYYCSMSVNVTYPDGPNNSSAILTNTTSVALWIRGSLKPYCNNYIVIPLAPSLLSLNSSDFKVELFHLHYAILVINVHAIYILPSLYI